MKHFLLRFQRIWIVLALLSSSLSLLAQVGKVGINTTTPAAMLHVKDSSVVFTGISSLPVTPGAPPVSGPGTRLMWYADKAALRGGRVTGQQWNKDSIGIYSLSYGLDTRAIGQSSMAFGQQARADGSSSIAIGINARATSSQAFAFGTGCLASGQWSVALGNNNTASGTFATVIGSNNVGAGANSTSMGFLTSASGDKSTALGYLTIASGIEATAIGASTVASGRGSIATGLSTKAIGDYSFSLGGETRATGDFSLAQGVGVISRAYNSIALGRFNDTTAMSTNNWIETDPLFAIGKGLSNSGRQNAVTILKNGNTGIGTTAPQKLLHVSSGNSGATAHSSAVGVFESNTNTSINLLAAESSQTAVYFGKTSDAVHGGIVYNATPSNGFAFRTNGNVTQAVITDAGRVGIGLTNPLKLLHVSGGSSGANVNVNAVAVFEDDGNAAINIITPAANESSILFGNPSSTAHGAILYNSTAPNGFTFRTNGNITKAVLTDIGRLGIGTTSPQRTLHVSNGATGATPSLTSAAVFEDDTDVSVSLLAPVGEQSTIYFGNPDGATQAGIQFNFPAIKGLAFGTNNNATRMVITEPGDVGIGDNSPNARMHVTEVAVGGSYHSEADLIIEDNNPTYLQFSTFSGDEAAILSGSNLTTLRSSINFRADSSFQIRTGGNNTRLTVNKSGSVGINTTTPGARLEVNGTVIVGANGTAITDIIKLTVLSDVPNVPAGGSATETFPVANCNTSSSVLISPNSALPNGLIIAYARVSVAGTVEAKFSNISASDINIPAMNFYITVIR